MTVFRHQQRRRGDDGADPVAEGVGQVRHPVGQGVVVFHGERAVQYDLHRIGILFRQEHLFFNRLRIA